MNINLVQNYITNISSKGNNQVSNKPKPDFDIQRELNNRTFIKPLKGRGKLVNNNFFNAPALMLKDIKYDMKALKHAVNGKANDHELGKLNDLGLMTGGFAIAGYLFTKRQTPMTKGMEFVGLGSFLASMAIWPKIAIQLPAYLVHGINVQKEYEDSFGRIKPFYQDPQFIPWDLYSDKEIQKLGDRLGVEKNIPNRRDAIQEKMKKIAVQNNTLWMLTAGFATPVMSGLICNQVTPYLESYLDKAKNKKADKILSNIEDYADKKYNTHSVSNLLAKIGAEHKDKVIDAELKKSIIEAFTENFDPITAESIKYDINQLLSSNEYSINEQTARNICKNLMEKGKKKKFSEEALKAVIPTEEEMVQLFREQGFFGEDKTSGSFHKINNYILGEIDSRVSQYNQSVEPSKQIKRLKNALLSTQHKGDVHPIKQELQRATAKKLTPDLLAKLKEAGKIFDTFSARNYALDEYAILKAGDAPETVIAKYWNDISNSLPKILGISDKEFEKVKLDQTLFADLLRNKLEHIASNDDAYNKVMEALLQKIAQINQRLPESKNSFNVLMDNLSAHERYGLQTGYENKVDSVFDNFSSSIRIRGFGKTADTISGKFLGDNVGTYRNLQKAYMSDRFLGVKSSFTRLISTLDFYRRVAKNPNALNGLAGQPLEVKEELIELCKRITLQGHSSDFATKFYLQRNPHPNLEQRGDVKVEEGKVINQFYGKTKNMVDIPDDKYFYQHAMQAMFEGNIDETTARIAEKYGLKGDLINYRELMLNKLGSDRYFVKPRHLIRPSRETFDNVKFLLTGISTDELVFKSSHQVWNTNKWLKMFAGFGAALFALTVSAQFFFGKMPKQKAGKND